MIRALVTLALLVWAGVLSVSPAQAANYCVISLPSGNEVGQYSRPLMVSRLAPDTNVTIRWRYQRAIAGTDTVRLRALGPDETTVRDLGTATINTALEATFTLNVPEGRY